MAHTVSNEITDEELNAIIQIESAGRPTIKASTSTALGLGQFLNATWLGTVKAHRPDVLRDNDKAEVLLMRKDPSFSIEMLARFTEDNARAIGRGYEPGDLYLAHFLGTGAARKVFRADPDANVEPLVGAAAVAANRSILKGKTCGEVRAWAARKMSKKPTENWVKKYYKGKKVSAPEDEDEFVRDIDVDEDTSVAPKDTTPHGKVSDQIANIQKSLVDMGYNEVGLIDGAWGGATAGAIKAFLNDRGLDNVPAEMSQPVIDEIAKARLENYKRPIAKERFDKTAKELAPYNPTVRSTLRTKALALWSGVGGAIVTGLNALSSYFTQAWELMHPVRDALSHVPWYVWGALAIGGSIALYYNAKGAEDDTVDAFKTRRLLR